VETAREVLTTLARRYAFGDLAALCEAGAARLPSRVAAEVRLLCSFEQQAVRGAQRAQRPAVAFLGRLWHPAGPRA
jgi:hypothetical protein